MPVINTYHGTYNRSRRASLGGIRFFAVHYTGTMASAKNNCIFFSTGNRNSSADLFVDLDGAIWEYNNVLDGWYTWHCGDGGGRHGITNANSIGVEVVSDGRDFTPEQIKALAWLYRHYCAVLGRKLEVVRHYDASRKRCPAAYVDEAKWASLKGQIINGHEEDDMLKDEIIKRPDGHETDGATMLGYLDQRVEGIERTLVSVVDMVSAMHAELTHTGDNGAGHGTDTGTTPLKRIPYIEAQGKVNAEKIGAEVL